MCLLIVLSRVVEGWPLIVAANRDERYDRPADPLGVLRERPRTLGGRDRIAGGTWLAVNEHGVVGGLTNKPMLGAAPAGRTRGAIPLALTAESTAVESVRVFETENDLGAFNPCWALAGDRDGLHSLDLTSPEAPRARALPPGLHVLENAPLDAPSPKAQHVREQLGDSGGRDPDDLLDVLRALLADHTITAPPRASDPHGELISCASACCVHFDGYGTRSAMLVRVPASPERAPEVWSSEGPSCTHPLEPASL